MANSSNTFNKTFLIISLVLVVLIAFGIFYFSNSDNSSDAAVAVFTYNGEKITIKASMLSNIEEIAARQNITINRSLAIERLVQLAVLNAQAKHLNIVPTNEQIDAAIDQQVTSLQSQGLDEALAAQNMTLADFKLSLRNSTIQDLTMQILFNLEVVSKLEVSQEQLQKIYQENPAEFAVPETVSVKHILICYAGAPQCVLNLTNEEAKQSIIGIYQALQNNASLEELAAQYSSDRGSAQRGGDIGQISRGQTVPQFETVAFDTPVGSYSLPFESAYGFHILAVYGKQAARQLSFEQVAPTLRQQLILQQANVLQQAYVNGLMANVEYAVVN